MPGCDIIEGHYYSQLMAAAHASYRWPAPARFTEPQVTGLPAGWQTTPTVL